MKFDYIVADPTGNITTLVLSGYTQDNRDEIIQEAFRTEPSCEQVGFIMPVSEDKIRIEMMGYEFCGNATLSAAAWQAGKNGISAGEETVITVDSSGADALLDVKVRCLEEIQTTDSRARNLYGSAPEGFCTDQTDTIPLYEGTVSMPVPEADSYKGYPLINFVGIFHLIVPADAFTDEQACSAVKEYASELGVPAMGMMLTHQYDEIIRGSDSGDITIRPLVYVPASNTLFWEHSCASGSASVGMYLADRDGVSVDLALHEPGGTLRVTSEPGGETWLWGHVTLSASF